MINRRNFLWYSLLLTAGCSTSTRLSSSSNSSQVKLPDSLQFTVTDAKGLEELERDYEPFRLELEKVLSTSIEFLPVDSTVDAAPAMLAGNLDLAWAGPSEYVILNARARAIPLVKINRPDYRTVIVVPVDSGIQSLADLKGKTLNVGQLGTTASHLGAVKLILDEGLSLPDITIIASDTQLSRLKAGEFEALSRGVPGYKQQLKDEGESEQDYLTIAQGPLLPGDVLAMSSQYEEQVIEAIRTQIIDHQEQLFQAILAGQSLSERFKGSTFEMANDTDYDMVREVYRAIGQEEMIQ